MKNDTNTYFTLMHADYVDDFFDFLLLRGRKVYSIHYGYYNELDLIVWGD